MRFGPSFEADLSKIRIRYLLKLNTVGALSGLAPLAGCGTESSEFPEVARCRSLTSGYIPSTPQACEIHSPEGCDDISPGLSDSETRGRASKSHRIPEGCEDFGQLCLRGGDARRSKKNGTLP